MSNVIVRNAGNIGPFVSIQEWTATGAPGEGNDADRLRCVRSNGTIEEYGFLVLGEYSLSTDIELAPTPMTVLPPVPTSVSMAQARKALILGGITIASVDAAIAAIEDDTERALAQTDWEYAGEVRRGSPWVVSLAPALGLSDAQVDALFIAAAAL